MTTPNLIPDLERDEEWRPVSDAAHYYVSDLGRVMRLDTGHILKPSPRRSRKGGPITHYAVNLGKADLRRVHHIVLNTFVGPCPEGMEGCHWDGDCANNCLANLRWDTRWANQQDSIRHGTKVDPPAQRRGSNARSWLNEDDVRCIRAEPHFHGVNTMLGKCFGVSHQTIRRIRLEAA